MPVRACRSYFSANSIRTRTCSSTNVEMSPCSPAAAINDDNNDDAAATADDDGGGVSGDDER